MKPSLCLCVWLVVLSITVGAGQPPEVSQPWSAHASAMRPNVLVLIADDQSRGAMGWEGHPWSRTPALDRLAADGARFSNSFVSTSLCSPSRASLLTGLHTRSHRVLDNNTSLPPDLPTFASMATAAGYDSAYVGKWHMGKQGGPRSGFEYTASYPGQGAYLGAVFEIGTRSSVRKSRSEGWVDDMATDLAIEFMQRDRDGPFLLVLGFKGPHSPCQPPRRLLEQYREVVVPVPKNADNLPPFPLRHEFMGLAAQARTSPKSFIPSERWAGESSQRHGARWRNRTGSIDEQIRDYYRVLSGVDENVGRLRAALEETGLLENTIVVYTSDNGMCLRNHGIIGKRVSYEEAIRVPLILSYPALYPQGSDVEESVLNIDLAPTLLELMGIRPHAGMQGRSLVTLLSGHSNVEWRDAVLVENYTHRPAVGPGYVPTNLAVRTQEWKLIQYPGRESWTELYHMASDPWELENLAGRPGYETTQESLMGFLRQAEEDIGSLPAWLDPR